MNMKKKVKNKIIQNLYQGLAALALSVSVFVLPVAGLAEEVPEKAAVPQKVVMPEEQVFLDPSQVEAAKQQLEADARNNSGPQNNAAAAEKEENKPENTAVPQPARQVKVVMPQEQVYLDPSQVEAAKQQKAEDARISAQPQAKNVEVVSGDRVIADVKVVEKDEKENVTSADNNAEIKKAEEEKAATTEVKQPEAAQQQEPIKETTEAPKTTDTTVTQPEVKSGETAAENKNETKTAAPEAQAVPQQKPVRLHRFGMAREFTTHHATVGEVLQDMHINLEERTVYPSPETKITDGMVIHVLARKSFLSQEEVEVPFGTQVINDPEMEFGSKKVEKEGVKGKDLVTYENITRPGREQKIELDRRRVVEPVNEIVRQGVAQSILTPNGYVRYKKKIYGEATAYTWGGGASGTTSIGLWPKRGIVAVDPRVIPYYTKLYIPGYGMAIAGDTGGAIVGTRIDLFMDSLYECYQWGRRDVEIYILE